MSSSCTDLRFADHSQLAVNRTFFHKMTVRGLCRVISKLAVIAKLVVILKKKLAANLTVQTDCWADFWESLSRSPLRPRFYQVQSLKSQLTCSIHYTKRLQSWLKIFWRGGPVSLECHEFNVFFRCFILFYYHYWFEVLFNGGRIRAFPRRRTSWVECVLIIFNLLLLLSLSLLIWLQKKYAEKKKYEGYSPQTRNVMSLMYSHYIFDLFVLLSLSLLIWSQKRYEGYSPQTWTALNLMHSCHFPSIMIIITNLMYDLIRGDYAAL